MPKVLEFAPQDMRSRRRLQALADEAAMVIAAMKKDGFYREGDEIIISKFIAFKSPGSHMQVVGIEQDCMAVRYRAGVQDRDALIGVASDHENRGFELKLEQVPVRGKNPPFLKVELSIYFHRENKTMTNPNKTPVDQALILTPDAPVLPPVEAPAIILPGAVAAEPITEQVELPVSSGPSEDPVEQPVPEALSYLIELQKLAEVQRLNAKTERDRLIEERHKDTRRFEEEKLKMMADFKALNAKARTTQTALNAVALLGMAASAFGIYHTWNKNKQAKAVE